MRLLYSFSIRLYYLAIAIASTFNAKAKKWLVGRFKWKENLAQFSNNEKEVYWFHFASLGEFEQGRPIIEALKSKKSNIFILITFFSPSGYEVRKNYELADFICYLPLDTPKNARFFLDAVSPKMAFFIKYEFWFNFLQELKTRKTNTYLISGIFRENQHFFKWYGKWFKKNLTAFTHFFVQNESSHKLLKNIGYENSSITGDTRFDRVIAIGKQKKSFPIIETFSKGSRVIVIGSNWPQDDEILVPFINSSGQSLKFIIAPHNIKSDQINRLLDRIELKTTKYSEVSQTNLIDTQVLIIDSIGFLSSLYQYGNLAYIGGGFGSNVHNILEAATFGLPTIFGPNYHKFQECKDLIKKGGSFCINNLMELQNTYAFLSKEENYTLSSRASSSYVENLSGATEKIINLLP